MLRESRAFIKKILTSNAGETGNVSLESAQKAQEIVISRVKDLKGVEGVGISPSREGYSVKISLSAPLSKEDRRSLPKQIEDVPITTQLTQRASAF